MVLEKHGERLTPTASRRAPRAPANRTGFLPVRIDAGGDCGALLGAFHHGARFMVKAKLDFELAEAIRRTNKRKWKTVDPGDAFGRPTRQVAEVDFARKNGAPAIEGYPVDNRGKKVDQTMAYVGTRAMFEKAGFTKAADTDSVSGGIPRVIMRLDLG